MIVLDEGKTYRLISQPDHARLAPEIVGQYREEHWPAPDRRDDVLFAVREHDNGWMEIDRSPVLDASTRGPCDFPRAPQESRLDIWRRGSRRHVAERPYAALLITHHALTLHAAFRGAPGWRELFEELDARQRALIEATGSSPSGLASDYGLLAAGDMLSLAACKRWRVPFSCGGVTGTVLGDDLRLCPFPLREPARIAVACRRIEKREFTSEAELSAAFAGAPLQEVVVGLLPAGP